MLLHVRSPNVLPNGEGFRPKTMPARLLSKIIGRAGFKHGVCGVLLTKSNRVNLMIATCVRMAAITLLTLAGCADGMQTANGTKTGRDKLDRSQAALAETGEIRWLRDFDEAKTVAAKVDKPILLLFQEIPG